MGQCHGNASIQSCRLRQEWAYTWPIHLNTASLSAGKFLRSLDNDRLDPKCQQAFDQRFSLQSPPGRELILNVSLYVDSFKIKLCISLCR